MILLNTVKKQPTADRKSFFSKLFFPAAIFTTYDILYLTIPDKTAAAFESSITVLGNIAIPLCLVFIFMTVMNIFLEPGQVAKILGRGSGIKGSIISTTAGIISAGPIYAWYPILKDLREKGASNSSIAIFLGNRAVKPFLLPIMISYFGWIYVLVLGILTVLASLAVGYSLDAALERKK